MPVQSVVAEVCDLQFGETLPEQSRALCRHGHRAIVVSEWMQRIVKTFLRADYSVIFKSCLILNEKTENKEGHNSLLTFPQTMFDGKKVKGYRIQPIHKKYKEKLKERKIMNDKDAKI